MRYFAYVLDVEKDVSSIDWRSFIVDAPEYEKEALAARAKQRNLVPLGDFVRTPEPRGYYPAAEMLTTVRGLVASCTASSEELECPQEILRDLGVLERLLVKLADAGVGVRLAVDKG